MNTNCGVANLVDRYLESIYPDYIDHTRSILIRQARDMLICRYHGDLQRFETDFMIPAAEIIDQVKLSCIKGSVSFSFFYFYFIDLIKSASSSTIILCLVGY